MEVCNFFYLIFTILIQSFSNLSFFYSEYIDIKQTPKNLAIVWKFDMFIFRILFIYLLNFIKISLEKHNIFIRDMSSSNIYDVC